jgi:oligopeptide/dipeptide ABC transporter ATP-binding protein
MQFIPQDAGASLTPHLTIEQLIGEGIEVHKVARDADVRRRVHALLDGLGLPARAATALPGELSTGERQRVAIARALAVEPELLICDEPVASVDADTRADLLERLDALRREQGLALLLISHDLAAVRRITSRIAVMYLGRIVEVGDSTVVATAPRMPYMQALLDAEPTGDPADRAMRQTLQGDVPAPTDTVDGCPFQPRCLHPQKDAQCSARPPLRDLGSGHLVACWKA